MKVLLKNCLSLNKLVIVFLVLFFFGYRFKAQTANYIANGSFEDYYNCNSIDLRRIKFWMSIDSVSFGGGFFSICNNLVPYNANTYQYPRTGNAHVISTMYNVSGSGTIGYLKNRLKSTLQMGRRYCVNFYVNICNTSPRGIDGFGIYFGNSLIDTISYCNIPLTYIYPQIKNPIGNVITDTLNWVAVTGTFVANGSEKYALIGNFLSDNAVATSSIGGPYFPAYWTDVCIDDVSCIDVDLPAFAGLDTFFIPGSSLYLGRERDVGIDEACTWYQLPNMATALDTAAGIWVTPVGTSTYVVRQEICGNVKWDTVVVRESPLGIEDLRLKGEGLKVWPIPAKDEIVLQLDNYSGSSEIFIFNNLGMIVRREDLIFKENKTLVRISELEEGVYFLELRTKDLRLRDKLLIER